MNEEAKLREQVVHLLRGGGAHQDLNHVFRKVPENARGTRPDSLPYSLWELLEHIRIAQWDILEFSRDPEHESPDWPGGYWPPDPAPPSPDAWDESLMKLSSDLERMAELVSDPEMDLFSPFPWGEGQNLFREALLVADHNAYHLGQVVALRRILGIWPPEE
ncbi:MAG: DinB family protein [Longimicrobiales bacterium]